MGDGSDILVVAAAALAVLSGSFTAFGRRQQQPRGWLWWVAGLWLTTAGVGAAAAGPAFAAPATLLLLLWPITTVIGLRRFHARVRLPLGERADWTVLVVAGALAATVPWWRGELSGAAALPASAAAFVHLYAACLLFCGPGGRDGMPLQALGLTMALVALAPLPAAWPGYEAIAPIDLRAIAATLGVVVMAFVVLTLVGERTDRQLRDSHRRLRALAHIDADALAPTPRRFEDLAQQALRNAAPGTASLLLCEVDHLRQMGDIFGHATAERVVRLVSINSQEQMRTHDVAGRHGSAGFALLLREVQVEDAGRVAARIVRRVQQEAAALLLPTPTLSFGMVQLGAAEHVDAALRRAERALSEAQRQGRARAVVAHGGADEPVFGESQPLDLHAI